MNKNICGQCTHFLPWELTEEYDKPHSWVLDWCTDPYKVKHGWFEMYNVTPRSHCVNFLERDDMDVLVYTTLSQENYLPSGDV